MRAGDEARSPVFRPEPVRPAPSSLSLFVALAFLIFVWSLNYIVAKIALREIPPLALGSFRLVTAGLVSLPVLFFRGAGKGQGVKVTPEVTSEVTFKKKGKRSRRLDELWTI